MTVKWLFERFVICFWKSRTSLHACKLNKLKKTLESSRNMHLNVPIFSTILKHFVWRFICSNSSFLCGYTALIGSMPRLLWLVYCILCMLVAEQDPNNKGRPICVSQTPTWSTDKSLQIVTHRIAPSFIMSPSNKNDRHSILIGTFLDNSGATADYQNYNVSLPRPTECIHNTTQHVARSTGGAN